MSDLTHCTHLNSIVDDYKTGDTICTFCGLILNERGAFESLTKFQGTSEDQITSPLDKYHMILIDFCHNACIPIKLALIAHQLYQKTRKEKNLALVTNSTRQLLFCSMYVVLHNHGSSFTLREIAAHSNIDLSTLSRLIRLFFDDHLSMETYPTAVDIVERLCANVQIERRKSLIILKNVEEFEKQNSSGLHPSTIASGFVFNYAKTNGINLSLEKICSVAGISSVSVKRFLKRFNLK